MECYQPLPGKTDTLGTPIHSLPHVHIVYHTVYTTPPSPPTVSHIPLDEVVHGGGYLERKQEEVSVGDGRIERPGVRIAADFSVG